MKNHNETYFHIVDKNHDMRDPKKFKTEEEARKAIETSYTNRSQNDGYDEYWRNRPQIVIKVTVENLN